VVMAASRVHAQQREARPIVVLVGLRRRHRRPAGSAHRGCHYGAADAVPALAAGSVTGSTATLAGKRRDRLRTHTGKNAALNPARAVIQEGRSPLCRRCQATGEPKIHSLAQSLLALAAAPWR